MELLLDSFIHLDRHLAELTAVYGPWIYAVLFLIIFAETGLIVTPFLPGDSLLFAAGALAAAGALQLEVLLGVLLSAAILGDAVNYSIGRVATRRLVLRPSHSRFWADGPGGGSPPDTGSSLAGATRPAPLLAARREHLVRAHRFFERYGGAAIVIGRFAPVVRTFVPFVAGAVSMPYGRFACCNVAGAAVWVGVCAGAGYTFGNLPTVREHFSLTVLGILVASVLPVAVGMFRRQRVADC